MRLLPPIVLALGLFGSLLLLFPRGAPTTAHAQSIAAATIITTHASTTTTSAAAAAHSLYLPLIHRGPDNPPTPTPHAFPHAASHQAKKRYSFGQPWFFRLAH